MQKCWVAKIVNERYICKFFCKILSLKQIFSKTILVYWAQFFIDN